MTFGSVSNLHPRPPAGGLDGDRLREIPRSRLGATAALVRRLASLPFAISALGVRACSRVHRAGRHRPLFDLVIRNVPGPPRSRPIAGAKLSADAPGPPAFDGLALILAVLSQAENLSFGVAADRGLPGDAWVSAQRLVD
jgi:hypothetical protein